MEEIKQEGGGEATPSPSVPTWFREWGEAIQDMDGAVEDLKRKNRVTTMALGGVALVVGLQGVMLTKVLKSIGQIGQFLQQLNSIPGQAVRMAQDPNIVVDPHNNGAPYTEAPSSPSSNGWDPGPQEMSEEERRKIEQEAEAVRLLRQQEEAP